MKVIYGIRKWNERVRSPVIALGVFDGVHVGHQRIISRAVRRAEKIVGTSIVTTFDPHPLKVINPKKSPSLLTSCEHRVKLFSYLGADVCLVVRFTRSFSQLEPDKFVGNFLVRRLRVTEMVVGENFAFGKDGSGGIKFLKEAALRYGFSLRKVKMARIGGKVVSSTVIRNLVEKGELMRAGRLLGRPVSVLGTVTAGSSRGRALGFPTANLNLHHEAIPPAGVYAVRVKYKGSVLSGLVNIGIRPTFNRPSAGRKRISPCVEVHILNFKKNIYGEELEVVFSGRIRDERTFSDRENLLRQIERDEIAARRILGRRG